nr:MAG TPA_asm: hypothetical protein [Caudoviricetes sp.]
MIILTRQMIPSRELSLSTSQLTTIPSCLLNTLMP